PLNPRCPVANRVWISTLAPRGIRHRRFTSPVGVQQERRTSREKVNNYLSPSLTEARKAEASGRPPRRRHCRLPRSNAKEHYRTEWMASVLRFQRVRSRIGGELNAGGDPQVGKHKIPVVAQGVSLRATDDALRKSGWRRLIRQPEFVGAIRIFDSPPHQITFSKAQRRLGQVAVPHQAI